MTAPLETFGTFGERLRAQRESHGVSLKEIAESTKIGLSLLSALERNDLTRWPKGIFRRAFFRAYVVAIGLPAEPMLAEFVRLFPEEPVSELQETNELRLVLDNGEGVVGTGVRTRLMLVLAELCGVAGFGVITGWAFGTSVMTASGVVALLYYPIANVCLGRTPSLRFLSGKGERRSFEWIHIPEPVLQAFRTAWRQRILSWHHLPPRADDERRPTASEWGTASN